MAQRLAKLIASRGLCSRRSAEDWIREGRVSVDAQVERNVATNVDADQVVKVDGRMLPDAPPPVYLLLYKPRGVLTGRNDPQGRKTVQDLISELRLPKVEPVGRLDFDTEGALILTNDGDLAHKLTHPSSRVPKRYLAKVWRVPTDRTLANLQKGVHLEDGKTAPCKVRVADSTDKGNAWLEITVTEGRNRLVRRMLQALNHPVSKLRRESFATISIRGLERGQARPLTKVEIERLRDLAAGKRPAKAGRAAMYKKGHARPKPKNRRGKKKSS